MHCHNHTSPIGCILTILVLNLPFQLPRLFFFCSFGSSDCGFLGFEVGVWHWYRRWWGVVGSKMAGYFLYHQSDAFGSPYVDLRRLAVKMLGLIRVCLVVVTLCKSRADVCPLRL